MFGEHTMTESLQLTDKPKIKFKKVFTHPDLVSNTSAVIFQWNAKRNVSKLLFTIQWQFKVTMAAKLNKREL